MSARPDADQVGRVLLVAPRMMMVQVVAWSTLLDLAFVEVLNLEGEPTGRHGTFAPSRMVPA